MRRGRVVGHADRVAAHIPEEREAAARGLRVPRRAERPEVVVQTHSAELDAAAVELEAAFVGVEGNRPDAVAVGVAFDFE